MLLRMKEDYDGAEPAAASVSVRNLLALGHLVNDAALIERASRALERYGPGIGRVARVMPLMTSNIALWHGEAPQVVIVGRAGRRGHDRVRDAACKDVRSRIDTALPVSPNGQSLRARQPIAVAGGDDGS